MSWVVELPSAIKVQNVPEHFWVSVEEIFLCVFIVEKLFLRRAQQCVRITIQSVFPRLEKRNRLKHTFKPPQNCFSGGCLSAGGVSHVQYVQSDRDNLLMPPKTRPL